jgi:hypothetical protein
MLPSFKRGVMEGIGSLLIGLAMFGNMLVAVYGLLIQHKNAKTIHTLEVNTNSKLERLLVVTAESEHAKGVIQGQQER